MREIKFRAILEGMETMTSPFDWYDLKMIPPVKVLMQYTGLKDKNGKYIYEGDIVVEGGDKHPSVVTFLQGSFQLVHNHYNLVGEVIGVYEQVLGFLIEPVEVIGNIYENPDLLEEANS